MTKFKLISKFKPKGDQPQAIEGLVKGLNKGLPYQTLLGVTGSGKTFSMANVIQAVQKPTLIISPNKTLAAQLCQEFRSFFPQNAVEYFVSFYDYYQPEAYMPHTDTYIEKDSSINEEIDRLRHEATMSVISRRDVIVVASVSCIYALGRPEDYKASTLILKLGQRITRDEIIEHLVSTKYERNDLEVSRGKFRVRGDVIEVQPAHDKNFIRIELLDDKVHKISEVETVSRKVLLARGFIGIYPATHYVTFQGRLKGALESIREELNLRTTELKKQKKLVEAQRLEQRTKYDLEMIKEMGYCSGIENYSRHLDGRKPGEPPGTLMDYFPDDYLLFIDESHITIPQLGGMYAGDRARKQNLVDYGFRLPSALDNRPLRFDEFKKRLNQAVFVSATPAKYEEEHSKQVVEQIIRPTGLVDPQLEVKPTKGQIEDLIGEIRKVIARKERILVTTLTKRMAEDLAEYLNEAGLAVRYLHSDIKTLERIDILRGLRLGKFDILVGINLLREGLDLPEVSLVAILDADKEGFLRSERSLIQTIGRAARNVNSKVILYGDELTRSMKGALNETSRRRKLQVKYNKKHGITPQTIIKEIHDIAEQIEAAKVKEIQKLKEFVPKEEVPAIIRALEEEMQAAAIALEFEKAAKIRDRVKELKKAFGIGGN
ncbi:MAG: excinuclease ABC subunit UvrB [Candidatus Saganbacteria bacterium]|nr:excinuclease ABC subunit UvrB [Candidatus Saganbacteria bacterium]